MAEALKPQADDDRAKRLVEKLRAFLQRVAQVIDHTVRHVPGGENGPAGEKLVSLFEPDTAISRSSLFGLYSS